MLLSTIRGKNSVGGQSAIKEIIAVAQKNGHSVEFEHIVRFSQTDLDGFSEEENLEYHNAILKKIKQSDVVVAETSCQSFSVGYLISYGINLGKPTILLYQEDMPKPNVLSLLSCSDKLMVETYGNISDLRKTLDISLEIASEKVDIRFNFFITPAINAYLNWVAKVKKVPRSVHIRNLIEQDMAANTEYSQT